MAERRLFGTDGVRGVAGEFLTAELATSLARAATATAAAASGSNRPRVLVIRDTRISGDMLEAAVCAGVTEAGGDALIGGVLPTPAAPLIVDRYGLTMAVVVSASHNPYADNGIKFFGADGMKLANDVEAEIEARLEEQPSSGEIGRIVRLAGAEDDYLRALFERFDLDLAGMKIALDCAHGATYRVAPRAFERFGAELVTMGVEPNGTNINDGVGSTHIAGLAELVREEEADLGFAFDGDGDRVLAVDRMGELVDGDELLVLLARHLKGRGELTGGGVAVTVMTNYGFHRAMAEAGIEAAVTKVGDRYVLEELRARKWRLGGEQSGHLIDLDFNTTGDGLASALLTMEALRRGGTNLEAGAVLERLPQRLENVPIADRDGVAGADDLWQAVEREQTQLEGRGRVLVRASGTEPLVRVMVEAPTEAECEAVCQRICTVLREQCAA